MALSWGKIGSFLRKWIGGLAEAEVGDILDDASGAEGAEAVEWVGEKLGEVVETMEDGAAKTALSVIQGAVESEGGAAALGVALTLLVTYLKANVVDVLDGEDDIPDV
jgi:hypothetical protein